MTEQEVRYAVASYLKRKQEVAAVAERNERLCALGPVKRTRAQYLNWEYGGAQGNLMHAQQAVKNVLAAIRRAGTHQTVLAGLLFEEQKVLHALAVYARKIDTHYQVEKSIHQGKSRKAKGKKDETL